MFIGRTHEVLRGFLVWCFVLFCAIPDLGFERKVAVPFCCLCAMFSAFVSVCRGTGLSSGVYSVLLLLSFIEFAGAVCTHCYGSADGCPGSGYENCPWYTTVATNAAAMVSTAAVSKVLVDKILPPRFVRIFSRQVLQTLSTIYDRPKGGVSYDFNGKTELQIQQAVSSGHVTREEGLQELSKRATNLSLSDSQFPEKLKLLDMHMSVIKSLSPEVSSSVGTDGCFLFILAKLSAVDCGSKPVNFDLCVEIDSEADKDGGSGNTRIKSKLVRPASMSQMCSLLLQFQLICCATGLTSVLAMTPFLDDVVFEPVRVGGVAWPVAFEMLLIYLRMIENDSSVYTLTNVVHKAGGMDALRKQALVVAQGFYPAVFFRTHGGNPETSGIQGDDKYQHRISGFDRTSKRGCAAWNNGSVHLAKHVDANGKCKFFHGCDQFVTDKGSGGQCLSTAHKRKDCDYDSSKKCSKPVP